MCIACAASGVSAEGKLGLLRLMVVVVGVGKDQALRGGGGRGRGSLPTSTNRLLQQCGQVQANNETKHGNILSRATLLL